MSWDEWRASRAEGGGLKGWLWDGWLAPVSKVTLYNCIMAEQDSGDGWGEAAWGRAGGWHGPFITRDWIKEDRGTFFWFQPWKRGIDGSLDLQTGLTFCGVSEWEQKKQRNGSSEADMRQSRETLRAKRITFSWEKLASSRLSFSFLLLLNVFSQIPPLWLLSSPSQLF